MMKNVLLISDNEILIERFKELSCLKMIDSVKFNYAYSSFNKSLNKKFQNKDWIKPINVKADIDEIIESFDLVFSLHCKQIFPDKLVENIKCINIHPGLNPHNRGWFPQVFSIINGLPCGATIHEIDTKLDHGPIICQKEVKIDSWDTSLTAYNKILDAEIELLESSLIDILEGSYETKIASEGNLNLKTDFDQLCLLNLDEKDTFLNHINRLRALTHGDYANAYFIDKEGNKVLIKVELSKI